MSLVSPEITGEDFARQLEHEASMLEAGRARYEAAASKDRARGNASATGGGRAILSSLIAPMANMIVEEIARLEGGGVRRKPPELRSLKLLPPRDMAALAIRTAIDAVCLDKGSLATVQKAGFRIGNMVSVEVMAREFRKAQRPLYEAIVRKVNQRTSNAEQRQKELLGAFSRVDDTATDPLDNVEKVRLGACLLNYLEVLGLVEAHSTRSRNRVVKHYEITESALATIKAADSLAAELQPSFLPTVIPPRPWTSLTSGGYWSPFRGTRMVVARNRSNGIKAAADDDMPHMFGPVNYLQATPFRINRKVLEVVRQMQASNISCASLPPSELEAIPAKPHDIDTNEEARTEWRRGARNVHVRNAVLKAKILAAAKTVNVAVSMREEPRIYFPKVVDFRGRVYDLPLFLKPQGDDLSKGLLEFGNGKPLGDGGGYWLAVHGANVWGEDKCSLDDRVAWVLANEAAILEIAENPFGNRMWMDADSPFQFLAFCFEWAGARREGDDYVSHLPIAMDGSCNGLQHLSAMLRDPIGGAAVNLVPASKPQDIYTEVMRKAVAELEKRAAMGEPTAQKWLPLMKRSVVKRPVMTLPYGATKQGFADQIMEDTIRPMQKEGICPFDVDPYAAARYLGEIVWQATGEVVVAARTAMDWLQEVAKVAAEAGKPIQWTTPSGFVVKQDYRDMRTRQVELHSYGQRLTVRVAEGFVDKIDRRKMAMAIAPNFVHAMDAAHMLRTVEYLLDTVGETVHLSMVHDSYATHACDAEALAYSLRHAFIEVYHEGDWLARFREEVADQLPPEAVEKLPPLPAQGTLDLSDVVNSLYFFA